MSWLNSTFLIGIIAQILFSARLIIQWVSSEKAHRVVSPTIFWILSLIASLLLIIYGVLRKDIVIVGGQLISYYIYIRNLQLKKTWSKIPLFLRHLFISLPILGLGYLFYSHQLEGLVYNKDIPRELLIWGTIGQAVFTLRFIYQWYASEKQGESVFPLSFWIVSLIGSLMIITYGFIRHDFVLILGQCFGMVVYIRNIMIYIKNHPNTWWKE